jgi:hypothetical protein
MNKSHIYTPTTFAWLEILSSSAKLFLVNFYAVSVIYFILFMFNFCRPFN